MHIGEHADMRHAAYSERVEYTACIFIHENANRVVHIIAFSDENME